MNYAEALPWKNPPTKPPLAEIKKEGEVVLPEELLLAMDTADALRILTTEIGDIQTALQTKRPIDPEVKNILKAFFRDDSPEAQAIRLLADQLARARILAERRSEKPRGPHLVS